jgi:hypothetical protein
MEITMIHSVRPAKPTTTAFTDLTEAITSTIQSHFDLFEMERSDARRAATIAAKVLAWLQAEELADSFALMPSTSMAADCRKVMAQQIFQVLQWEDCDPEIMVAVFLEASRAAHALPKGTVESAELMRALVLLDALIELQAQLLGLIESVPQGH